MNCVLILCEVCTVLERIMTDSLQEENGGSSGLGVMTALPLIDTEAMSGES